MSLLLPFCTGHLRRGVCFGESRRRFRSTPDETFILEEQLFPLTQNLPTQAIMCYSADQLDSGTGTVVIIGGSIGGDSFARSSLHLIHHVFPSVVCACLGVCFEQQSVMQTALLKNMGAEQPAVQRVDQSLFSQALSMPCIAQDLDAISRSIQSKIQHPWPCKALRHGPQGLTSILQRFSQCWYRLPVPMLALRCHADVSAQPGTANIACRLLSPGSAGRAFFL